MKREPDRVINKDYLKRWYIIPRNRWFNVYLHEFNRSDDDRAFHDHPWYSCSFLVSGEMKEHSYKGIRLLYKFLPVFRTAKFAHRLELVKGPVTTLFITGPVQRSWGFHADNGWIPWEEFVTYEGEPIEQEVI